MSGAVAAFTIVLALVTAITGCALIALSQPRICRVVAPSGGSSRLTRPLGWTLLFGAFVFCLARDGPSLGILAWLLIIMLSVFLVALAIAYLPSVLIPLVRLFAK